MSSTNVVQFQLMNSFCIEVAGSDAARVLNNVCTNDVAKLEAFNCCEAFVTDVRGWVVVHAIIVQHESHLLLVGQHPSPDDICEHIDRYIIREDAVVRNLSDNHDASLLVADERGTALETVARRMSPVDSRVVLYEFEGKPVLTIPVPIGEFGEWWVCEHSVAKELQSALCTSGHRIGTTDELELLRVKSCWPVHGREILEKTLPQELDRNELAISFTKGCYLGQETIARLDARGQIQKKLCLLRMDSGGSPEPGTALLNGEKEVGSLTSVAADGSSIWALARLRRGSFDVGTTLSVGTGIATVVR